MSDITIIRGDDKTFNITITDKNGDPFNLTGYTVFFTVKRSFRESTDEDALISKNITSFSSPTSGTFPMSLTHTDTDIIGGEYWYDMQLKSAGGTITSIRRAKFTIIDDVTRRTTV